MKVRILFVAILVSCVGCVQTGRAPTVGSFGSGSDAAYINGTRGRSDSQMTEAQALQASRQRQQVAEEMELERQKTANSIEATKGYMDIVGGISNSVLPWVRGF